MTRGGAVFEVAKGTRSRVPELMAALGMDATALARAASIAYGTARRLKAGEVGPFTTNTLERVARALGRETWLDLFEEFELPEAG